MNIAALCAFLQPHGSGPSGRVSAFRTTLATRHGLSALLETDQMTVLAEASAPHFVQPSSALFWGHLFDRHSNRRLATVADMRGAEAPACEFVASCWGGFLALRVLDGVPEVLRDPSGGVPCYHAQIDGTHLFTTRPELLFDSGLLAAELDWTILAQAVAYRDQKPARTPLRGVSELLPGTVARLVRGQTEIETIWSPWRFTDAAHAIDGPAEAVELVRRASENCISAWRGCFRRPLIELSGGLDSSIVAALLGAPGDAIAATFAAAEGDPDETHYASAVASHLGLGLSVLKARIEDVDLTRSAAHDVPRPCARGFAQAMDAQLRTLAGVRGADAFFSGGGGDNVFCFLQSVLPVVDRLYRTGIGAGTFSTIADMAELARVSVWEVAARSVKAAIPRRRPIWKFQENILSAEAGHALPLPRGHPWGDVPEGMLPGKIAHVRALIGVQNHLEGHPRLRMAPIVSPLLSQPLVETCLSVPSWLWCADGHNRAVARAAFARYLPREVIERRSKGAFDGFCAQLVYRNRVLIREMLIDGELVRQRLVAAADVEAWLRDTRGTEIGKLLALTDVEAWIAAWQDRRPK